MEQANQESAAQFQKNNGMSIEEAYNHVKNWYEEGKYSEVIDGCEEILRYVDSYEDVQRILEDSKAKLAEKNHSTEEAAVPQEAKSSTPPSEKPEKKNNQDEEYKGALSTDEKILSAIGYLGFLAILPLLLKKDSKYCDFHGKQALVLAIFFFLFRYLGILRDIPGIGGLIKFMLGTVMLFELVVIIIAMIQAYRGKYWKIPLIYGMSQKLKF